MNIRVYLAGPEVFLPNAREIGARKRAICEQHGLAGVFPTDEENGFDPALCLSERAQGISRAMERVMQGCDAMIVNLTPFRGPSADVGSAYEMGFMRALGRSIFAYSNDGCSWSGSEPSVVEPSGCARPVSTKIRTGWRSSRSNCTITSCLQAGSRRQGGASLQTPLHPPSDTRR
jgi:nucleoside 2-deoxyribosyltransferase